MAGWRPVGDGVPTMRSERFKRCALYVAAGLMWAAAGGLAAHAAITESFVSRTLVMFALAIAGAITTAALLVMYVTPVDKVYDHGYEHGRQSVQPEIRMVVGERPGARAPVIPIRALQQDRFRG